MAVRSSSSPLQVVSPPTEDLRVSESTDPVPVKGGTYEFFKRGMDLIGAASLLLLSSPLLLLVATAVKCSSKGGIIFRQQRLTAGGRVFTMYKFRTMASDAESDTGAVWAAKSDPRVTRLGKLLRKTRLDELPQLFNVLKGDMSLIGPRPERPEIAVQLSQRIPSFNRRLAVKAGITGLAQVSNGYAACMTSYKRKLALDLIYIRNRCLMLDLRIAARTIMVVLTGFGSR